MSISWKYVGAFNIFLQKLKPVNNQNANMLAHLIVWPVTLSAERL